MVNLADTQNETELETDDDDETETEFDLQSVERTYFAPDELQSGVEYLNKITAIEPQPEIKKNFDETEENFEFPGGFGLAVVPVSKRSETGKGNVTIGVAVAAIPDPATIADHPKGAEFIRSGIIDLFMAKVANSVRPRADGQAAGSMPKTVEDFIESRRGRESLKAFSEVAPAFVKALRKKGLKMMTAPLLRQILQSDAFAKSMPIPQKEGLWVAIGNKMIAAATAKGHDAGVIKNWLENRDKVEITEVEELDLSELDDLV